MLRSRRRRGQPAAPAFRIRGQYDQTADALVLHRGHDGIHDDLHRSHDPQPYSIRRADARRCHYASGHRRQARLAPEELHQLPHAARRRGILRTGPDQDCTAARRRLSTTVSSGSFTLLLRGAARAPHAQPTALGRADHRGYRVSDVGLTHRQPELAPAPNRRHRCLPAGHRPRRHASGSRIC